MLVSRRVCLATCHVTLTLTHRNQHGKDAQIETTKQSSAIFGRFFLKPIHNWKCTKHQKTSKDAGKKPQE